MATILFLVFVFVIFKALFSMPKYIRKSNQQKQYKKAKKQYEARQIEEQKRLEEHEQHLSAIMAETDAALAYADSLDGHQFEYWCADLLRSNGYSDVDVTPGSGDQGVDILAKQGGISYAIQCKHYKGSVGNTPVQEVTAGKAYYNCDVGIVMTNSRFTDRAYDLAKINGIILWDREKLKELIDRIQRK